MSSRGRPSQKPATTSGREQMKNQGKPAAPQITKPVLPPGYNRMLKAKGEDKDLQCIVVRFYDKGMQDISFEVKEDNGSTRLLSAGEYQIYRTSLAPKIDAKKEEEAAVAFFQKLESRCWIKCSKHDSASARRVKALKWPAPVLTAFSFSQKEIKAKKLTSVRMFQIWKELPENITEMIRSFQKDVDPVYDWKATIQNYALFAEKVTREEKERALKKAEAIKASALDPSTSWADDGEEVAAGGKLPYNQAGTDELVDPFAQLANDDEEDPLHRPTSPKPTASGNGKGGSMISSLFRGRAGKTDPKGDPTKEEEKELEEASKSL